MVKEGEAQLRTTSFVQETGIDINYGEKTWRKVQFVIDLFQNHMDANTTAYEREVLGLAGIKKYDPSSEEQQGTISLLNKIKYSGRQKDIDKHYSTLVGLGINVSTKESLQEQLKKVNYRLPDVRLRLTNGADSKLVEYSQVKKLPNEWKVGGFQVKDIGSGFDHKLLGMMGATTKKESTGKRGGLGEGLKMSVTHLKRAGAEVCLSSTNEDLAWTASPKVEDGSIRFEGRSQERAESEATGSWTDVDFTSQNFDPKVKTEIADALDPRKGEGLGKYILEFRDPQFAAVINSSREVSSMDVPGGRVYVKGLLVEEPDNLLWSYNLGEKWAIGGRDRKTVKRDVLMDSIRRVVENLETPEQIGTLVQKLGGQLNDDQKKLQDQAIEALIDRIRGVEKTLDTPSEEIGSFGTLSENKNYLELQVLDGDLQLSDTQEEVWRQAIEKVFHFSPGKQLFASSELSSEQLRFAEERGYKIISFPSEKMKAVELFKKLYPDQVVSFEQFRGGREIDFIPVKRRKVEATPVLGGEEVKKDDPVNVEVAVVLDGYKDGFTSMVTKIQDNRGYFVPDQLTRLRDLKFAQENGQTNFELGSSFEYNAARNMLYVREGGVGEDFATLADVYVQFLKAATGKDTFDVKSQDLLTQMAGGAVANLRPELLTEFKFSRFNGKSTFESSMTYPNEQRLKDNELLALNRYLNVLDTPNIPKDKLEEALAYLRPVRALNWYKHTRESHQVIREIRSKTQDLLHYEGKRYSIKGLELKEADYCYQGEVLELGELGYKLDKGKLAYLPIELQENESMRLSFSIDGDKEAMLVLKRRGNRILATKVEDGKTELLKRGESSYYADNLFIVKLYKDLLHIMQVYDYGKDVTVRKRERRATEQLEETNKGKEFISSNITIDYGGEVWMDPKRILLDAIQNHIDARRGQVPDVSYTVVGTDGKVVRVSKDELQNMGDEWRIAGVEVSDQGEGYPTSYLTRLGSSTKSDEDLGKFGEGLKLLAASSVRQGIRVEIGSRDWSAEPKVYEQTVKDYETGSETIFNMLGYNMKWQDEPQAGSRTSFSLISLEPGREQLTPEEIIELESMLSLEASTGEIWHEWTEVLDPRRVDEFGQRGLDRYVLVDEGETHTDGVVSVSMKNRGRVYEKGLLIPGEIYRQMMFGYNLDETIIDTRERNSFNKELLDSYLADYFSNLEDTEIMRRVFEMSRENSHVDFYEYKFLNLNRRFEIPEASEITKVLWRQTYYDMYGDDAILSLRPELNRIDRSLRSLDKNRIDYYLLSEERESIAPAVENEVHLENENLKMLPEALTTFFSSVVYTSRDALEARKCGEVELDHEDKEKLGRFVKTANEAVLTVLESLGSSQDSRQYLGRVVNPEVLRARKENLQKMPAENVRIKVPSFKSLGRVEEQDGQAVVYLNQNILSDPRKLLDVYVHEVSHYLSGQDDYVIGFQRFLMALAVAKR